MWTLTWCSQSTSQSHVRWPIQNAASGADSRLHPSRLQSDDLAMHYQFGASYGKEIDLSFEPQALRKFSQARPLDPLRRPQNAAPCLARRELHAFQCIPPPLLAQAFMSVTRTRGQKRMEAATQVIQSGVRRWRARRAVSRRYAEEWEKVTQASRFTIWESFDSLASRVQIFISFASFESQRFSIIRIFCESIVKCLHSCVPHGSTHAQRTSALKRMATSTQPLATPLKIED